MPVVNAKRKVKIQGVSDRGRPSSNTSSQAKRKVVIGRGPPKDGARKSSLTLDARFSFLTQLREETVTRQQTSRDALLAKKRGLAVPVQPAGSKVGLLGSV